MAVGAYWNEARENAFLRTASKSFQQRELEKSAKLEEEKRLSLLKKLDTRYGDGRRLLKCTAVLDAVASSLGKNGKRALIAAELNEPITLVFFPIKLGQDTLVLDFEGPTIIRRYSPTEFRVMSSDDKKSVSLKLGDEGFRWLRDSGFREGKHCSKGVGWHGSVYDRKAPTRP